MIIFVIMELLFEKFWFCILYLMSGCCLSFPRQMIAMNNNIPINFGANEQELNQLNIIKYSNVSKNIENLR